MRSPENGETTKTIRETEAEAVAFAVCHGVGLETGTAASDYIQLYNGSSETLQESLHHIRDCAARILNGIFTEENVAVPVETKQPTRVRQQSLF